MVKRNSVKMIKKVSEIAFLKWRLPIYSFSKNNSDLYQDKMVLVGLN